MPDNIHGEQNPPGHEEDPQPPTELSGQSAAQAEGRVPQAAPKPEEDAAPAVLRNAGTAGEEVRRVAPAERKRMNRRELLKLVPVVALGAFRSEERPGG